MLLQTIRDFEGGISVDQIILDQGVWAIDGVLKL